MNQFDKTSYSDKDGPPKVWLLSVLGVNERFEINPAGRL